MTVNVDAKQPVVHTPHNKDLPHPKCHSWNFSSGPVAKTPSSQCREPKFKPQPRNQIPYASTKSLHAAMKMEGLASHNEELVQPNKYIKLNIKNTNKNPPNVTGAKIEKPCSHPLQTLYHNLTCLHAFLSVSSHPTPLNESSTKPGTGFGSLSLRLPKQFWAKRTVLLCICGLN